MTELSFFNLRCSLIKTLLLLAIAAPAYSIVFRCEFSYIAWPVANLRYTCDVTAVQNPAEVTNVTGILGSHTLLHKNFDIEALSMVGTNFFSKIPANVESFFPNLLVLSVVDRLKSVSAADLKPWPNLMVLSLGGNLITTLDGNLFQFSLSLKHISFYDNPITNIGVNLLSSLNLLTYVSFGKTSCINSYAGTPQAIADLRTQLIKKCPSHETTLKPTTTVATSTTTKPTTTTIQTTEEPTTTSTPIETTVTVSSTIADELDECPARCSINEDADDLRALADELRALAEEHAQRIEKFLASNPCSCSL